MYQFGDVSHYNPEHDAQQAAQAGDRLLVVKISDLYNMVLPDGTFSWNPQNHFDSLAPFHVDAARKAGLVTAGYHFSRYDRPWNGSPEAIATESLDYYIKGLELAGIEPKSTRPIIDMEQSIAQLKAAGLTPHAVAKISMKMVERFENYFNKLSIIYTNQSWGDVNLVDCPGSKEFFRERWLWVANYKTINSTNGLRYPWQKPAIPLPWVGVGKEKGREHDWLFWQYTRVSTQPGTNKKFDRNFMWMKKEDMYTFFGQSGAVDPPAPVPPTPTGPAPQEVIDYLEVEIREANKREFEEARQKYNK